MKSRMADALKLHHPPVCLIRAQQPPPEATMFKEGRWGCVVWLVTSAAKGKVAAADRKHFGCIGGGVGLGFGPLYENFPGGFSCFCRFLSDGNEKSPEGRAAAEQVKPFMDAHAYDEFVNGERYLKTPEMTRRFVESLPVDDAEEPFVVFKSINALTQEDPTPESVTILAGPDQISALTVLANYGRGHNENVIVPFAAGCQSIGIYPRREAARDEPRAVLGLVDISARLQVLRTLGGRLMSFSMPWKLYEEMEANVAGSFLERPTWAELTA